MEQKGVKIKNIIKHSKIKYTLILAISNKKIIHSEIIKCSANGEIFLKFLKDLIKKLCVEDNNYILLDNARIHHYNKVKEFINTFWIPRFYFLQSKNKIRAKMFVRVLFPLQCNGNKTSRQNLI